MTDSELVIDRFAQLGQLKNGWFDGEGDAIPTDVLDWAKGVVLELCALDEERPRIFPMFNGGVQIEGDAGKWGWDAELLRPDCAVVMCADADDGRHDGTEWQPFGPVSLAETISAFIRRVEAM